MSRATAIAPVKWTVVDKTFWVSTSTVPTVGPCRTRTSVRRRTYPYCNYLCDVDTSRRSQPVTHSTRS